MQSISSICISRKFYTHIHAHIYMKDTQTSNCGCLYGGDCRSRKERQKEFEVNNAFSYLNILPRDYISFIITVRKIPSFGTVSRRYRIPKKQEESQNKGQSSKWNKFSLIFLIQSRAPYSEALGLNPSSANLSAVEPLTT